MCGRTGNAIKNGFAKKDKYAREKGVSTAGLTDDEKHRKVKSA